eukprot:s4249_g5.t2
MGAGGGCLHGHVQVRATADPSGASSDSRGSADSCALLAREPGDPAKLPSAGTEVGRWHLGRGADSDPAVGSAGELAGELHSLPLNVLDMPLDGHECVDRLVFGGPVAHAAVSLGTLRALHFKGRCVGGASCTSEGASPSGCQHCVVSAAARMDFSPLQVGSWTTCTIPVTTETPLPPPADPPPSSQVPFFQKLHFSPKCPRSTPLAGNSSPKRTWPSFPDIVRWINMQWRRFCN